VISEKRRRRGVFLIHIDHNSIETIKTVRAYAGEVKAYIESESYFGGRKMKMSEYLSFKRFITPTFIMIIYILGALVLTIGSILLMVFGAGVGGAGVAVILGIIMLIFGNLAWRMLCEYWIVQFRIYEEIAALNRHMGGTSPQPTAPSPPPAPATTTCPTCGSPLRYIQQYQRWYCDKEQKYV
jgi:hypothetical protein